MESPIAFTFKNEILNGPKAFPAAMGAAADGSLFIFDAESFFSVYNVTEGKWKRIVSTDYRSFTADVPDYLIAPVKSDFCYFIMVNGTKQTICLYSGTSSITTLSPLPNNVSPVAISAGLDGTLWASGNDGNFYSYNSQSKDWLALPSPGKKVKCFSVGSSNFILALVGDFDDSNVLKFSDNKWVHFDSGEMLSWIGACENGTYWAYPKPAFALIFFQEPGKPKLFLLPPQSIYGFARASSFGCQVYVLNQIEIKCVSNGVLDTPMIPFPQFSGEQQTAFTAISLAVHNPGPEGIRKSYTNLNAPIEDYFSTVNSMKCPPMVSPDNWVSVQKQILNELSAASSVRYLFSNIKSLNMQINILQLAIYNKVVTDVGLPAQPAEQPSTLVDVILGKIVDKIFDAAQKAVEAEVPEIKPIINLGLNVYKFAATQIANKHGASSSDVAFKLACSQLAQTLADTEIEMVKTSGQFETTILTDWGKLSACGESIESNYWNWPPGFDYSILSETGKAVEVDYYQTLMPVLWQIACIQTVFIPGVIMSNPYLPYVPMYSLLYQHEGSVPEQAVFWWWVCSALGSSTKPSTTGPFPNQNLIYKIFMDTKTAASDFFGGTNGWNLPVAVQDGYTRPPAGLPFADWVNSDKPANS